MANSTYYKKNVHITEKKIGIRKSTIQSLKKNYKANTLTHYKKSLQIDNRFFISFF